MERKLPALFVSDLSAKGVERLALQNWHALALFPFMR